MDFLFGCMQCGSPGRTDVAIVVLDVWLLTTAALALVAAWARRRPR